MSLSKVLIVLVLAMVAAMGSIRSLAQCELAKLTASAPWASAAFGSSVSMTGDVLVVGAPLDGGFAGSAYVYRLDGTGWIEEAKLSASDAGETDMFGNSVSVSGNIAVIGAPTANVAGQAWAGAAYVYRFDGTEWVEEVKLAAPDAAEGDCFGNSVSVSGDLVVIGAWEDDHAGSRSGSAYVFRFDGSTWVEEAKLTASDAAADDSFALCVSVSGDVAVIGSPGGDDPGTVSGAAYVYRFDGAEWSEEPKLSVSTLPRPSAFGWSVSIDGDVAVVGARHGWGDAPGNAGLAYVFRFDGTEWIEEAKLTASDAAKNDRFGESVSISGDVAVIGAIYTDDACPEDPYCFSGSAYVYWFDGANWIEKAKLTASDAACAREFGNSVSISGDIAVIGAFHDDEAGPNTGAVYTFAVAGDCNGNGVPDLCDIADGTSEDANSNGLPDECTCVNDDDCNDHNECTEGDSCDPEADLDGCVYEYHVRLFGDVYPLPEGDGAVEGFDILCVMDQANSVDRPDCLNGDIYPCDPPDGTVEGFDLLAVLDAAAFAGSNWCPDPCPGM